jgi:hypothetical protein
MHRLLPFGVNLLQARASSLRTNIRRGSLLQDSESRLVVSSRLETSRKPTIEVICSTSLVHLSFFLSQVSETDEIPVE